MKKTSQVVGKASKNVTHIVGKLKKLRSEIPDKKQFVTHISSGNWLGGGLGLVFWKINKIKNQDVKINLLKDMSNPVLNDLFNLEQFEEHES